MKPFDEFLDRDVDITDVNGKKVMKNTVVTNEDGTKKHTIEFGVDLDKKKDTNTISKKSGKL